jgi:3'-phosphoadenosine 5'-phosphosulfate sulfotransferase (PAPS reductase)/FAD synthetase
MIQNDVSISGGKDSQAVACLYVERLARRPAGNLPPRFFFANTHNEDQITLDHVDYLSDWIERETGQRIVEVTGYDVPGLIDATAFERKRGVIRDEWRHERRRKRHDQICGKRRRAIPKLAPGCRHSPERAAALLEWVRLCECPIEVSPPVPDHLIVRAMAALQPTGVAFLDMAMLHGRFPGARTRFCTEELKLLPLMARKRPLLDEGVDIVSWLGERADESLARRNKRPIERIRYERASEIIYRPIHGWTAEQALAIAARHGLRHNPLYTMGLSRVGCFPCILCKKAELRQIAQRFPHHIDRLEEWETIVGLVSRRVVHLEHPVSTFFMAPMVPGDPLDQHRASIRNAAEWAKTSRGGRQFDLLNLAEREAGDEDGFLCESAYGLCE